MTRQSKGNARVRNTFKQERTVINQTVPLNLATDSEAGTFLIVLSFIAFPGEHTLIVLVRKMLRGVLSSDARTDARRTVMEVSGEGKRI